MSYTVADEDETTERLVAMTNTTCLVALDKTLAAIRRTRPYYGQSKSWKPDFAPAAAQVGSIAERIVRAAHEVGLNLPEEDRV